MAATTKLVRDPLPYTDPRFPTQAKKSLPAGLLAGPCPPALWRALAAVAANRNTCQIRNLPNPIKTQDITFSNRN